MVGEDAEGVGSKGPNQRVEGGTDEKIWLSR